MKMKDILDNHRVRLEEVNRYQKTLENLVFHPSGVQTDLDGLRSALRRFAESAINLDRFEQREWGEQ